MTPVVPGGPDVTAVAEAIYEWMPPPSKARSECHKVAQVAVATLVERGWAAGSVVLARRVRRALTASEGEGA